MPSTGFVPSISDEAVSKATGKNWKHWFQVLDKFDVKNNGHKAAALFLFDKCGVPGWWSQMITVEYERERGLRKVGERPDGFEISASKTIAAPVSKVFSAWANADKLNRWFTTGAVQQFKTGGTYSNNNHDKGVFKRIVLNRTIKFTWDNENHCPGTMVMVEFTPKPDGRTVVRITHSRIKSLKEAEGMKTGWKWALDSLANFCETGNGIQYAEWDRQRLSVAAR